MQSSTRSTLPSVTSTPRLAALVLLAATLVACGDTDAGGDTDASSSGSEATGTAATASDASSSGSSVETTADVGSSSSTDADSTTGGSDTSSDDGTTGQACDPDVIELPGDMLFPEGIDATSDGVLFVGTIGTREILRITPCADGLGEHLVEVFHDGSALDPVGGVLVDEANGVLWACTSDVFAMLPPSVQGLDLATGEIVASHGIDFGLCNDVAMDDDGNLYATESFGSRIMRVAAADVLGDTPAETWSADPAFAVAPGELGLNGIAFFDGALVVGHLASGTLLRVAADGDTALPAEPIELGGTLRGPDGIEPESASTLLVVENTGHALTRVSFDGDQASTEVLDEGFDVPTTVVDLDGFAWVVESQLDHLLDPELAGPPEPPFVLVRRAL